ncbi:hypothetical protein D0869_13923 [Hortaea werneckii]|uniref:Histidine kinase n=1 Tax=Hortaea werneckii TaxID=91943 RepID=A0A3M6W3I7_HORWE|nr:hypothetical protein KC324_g10402 [Hortaea werneckii]RMX73122.1 hypothetical protein D0869_13923 [Hortaea werneckii]RMX90649.1 hypothetical protein D0868_14455 [Hortaea werneckii]
MDLAEEAQVTEHLDDGDRPLVTSSEATLEEMTPAEIRSVEWTRDQEFYKYYAPYRAAVTADYVESPRDGRPRSADDKALLAFAQLGALRMRARRCMISLFSRGHQFVLAEATKTLSLQSDQVDDPEDAVSWGVCEIPRDAEPLCENTIRVSEHFVDSADGRRTEVGIVTFPDLTQHPVYSGYPFVCGGSPPTRFYAGVPIRTASGVALGSYCVLDDHPRSGVTANEIAFMKDMATTVLVHLEMVRASEEIKRNERLVRGLGSFVEGENSIADFRRKSGSSMISEPPGSTPQTWYNRQYALQRGNTPRSSGQGSTAGGETPESQVSPGREAIPALQSPDAGAASLNRQRQPSDRSTSGSVTATTSQASEQAVSKAVQKLTLSGKQKLEPLEIPNASKSPKSQRSSFNKLDKRHTFARAANIIRESVETDGVVIYDASSRTFGGMVEDPDQDVAGTTNKDDDESVSPRTTSGTGTESEGVQDGRQKQPEKLCKILGHATLESSSLKGGEPGSSISLMTEKLLRSILKRFPFGRVFSFDNYAYASEKPGNNSKALRSKKKGLQPSEKQLLRELFPGVQSLIVMPMYDVNRQRNYAGTFVWSQNPQRIFSSEQALTYIAAFCDSVMAEIARIEAKIGERIRSDFISSISHELRSPLHGILGSIEHLSETELDSFQKALLQTADTCGKTLLDVINHLLDYAKINNLTRFKENTPRSAMRRATQSETSTESVGTTVSKARRLRRQMSHGNVDLCGVTEEVVETVCAGDDFQRGGGVDRNIGTQATRTASTDQVPSEDLSDFEDETKPSRKKVSVILDIDNSDHRMWLFHTPVGAWRRIIMNLVGNALKYTEQGHIHVQLRAERTQASQNTSEVTLVVSDTGIGISQDFLETQLFVPFAQEDSLSTGTGLGLSIIKQIVSEMGGTVDIQSEKGKGTQCFVKVVLNHTQSSIVSEGQVATGEAKAILKGATVGFLGFGDVVAATSSNTSHPEGSSTLLGYSLYTMCRDWCDLEAFTLPRIPLANVDICIVSESAVDELRSMNGGEFATKYGLSITTPLLVASRSGLPSLSQNVEHDAVVRAMDQIGLPCGPRRLIKILANSLQRSRNETVDEEVLPNDQMTPQQESPAQVQSREAEPEPSGLVPDQPRLSLQEDPRHTSRSVSIRPAARRAETQPVPAIDARRKSIPSLPFGQTAPQGPGTKRVLVVDDNSVNVQLLVMFMRKNGHAYQTAHNGLDALQKFQIATSGHSDSVSMSPTVSRRASVASQNSLDGFDFVLMDLSMPVMDGLESTRRIRGHERTLQAQYEARGEKYTSATIIALTGLASTQAQQDAFSSGIDHFMAKPVKLAELKNLMQQTAQDREVAEDSKE